MDIVEKFGSNLGRSVPTTKLTSWPNFPQTVVQPAISNPSGHDLG